MEQTVIYALFAGALLISQWVMKKPLIQRMLGKELALPPASLVKTERTAWALLFCACGLAAASSGLPQNIWVQRFKGLGLTALTLIFTLLRAASPYHRHLPREDKS